MNPLPRLDVAIVALITTMVVALGVIAYAVLVLRPSDSQTALVLATSTATPSGPTAIPWVDSTIGPSPVASPHQQILLPSPTQDPAKLAVRPCRAEDLAVGTDSDGSARGDIVYLAFANVATDPCRLGGTPDVVALDASGSPVPGGTVPGNCGAYGCTIGVLSPTAKPVGGKVTFKVGEARVELHWSFPFPPVPSASPCSTNAATARIALPDGGGDLSVPIEGDGCVPMSVSPFYVFPEPEPRPQPFAVHLIAPTAVLSGTTLQYLVELTNLSADAVTLLSTFCPNYVEQLGAITVQKVKALNCADVGPIVPGQIAVFAMQLVVPAGLAPGTLDLSWNWYDSYSGGDRTIVTVNAPSP